MSRELIENHVRFEDNWRSELLKCTESLSGNEIYARSYFRLVSLQAWRSELLQETLSAEAMQFALEGQNDLLVSYLLARGGQWRSALQLLRAGVENYLSSFYFMDHPIEVQLWEAGSFKTQFSELVQYFVNHPKSAKIGRDKSGLDMIKSEYATLSKAVHASAVSFRMSANDEPKLFSDSIPDLGMWETRSKMVCRGLNLLMISLFDDHLVASRKRNLRKAICYSLTKSDKAWIKEVYSITLPFESVA